MINNFVRVFFKIFIQLLKWVSNIALLPLTALLNLITPNFNSWLTDAMNFFDEYIIQAIAFGREVFLNMTGFPQILLTLSIDAFMIYLTHITIIKMVVFIRNIWASFKGGTTK